MKTIHLVRQAEPRWDDELAPAGDQRPTGLHRRSEVMWVAAYLARRRPRPMSALCSSARGSLETYQAIGFAFDHGAVSPAAGPDPADAEDLLASLQELPESVGSVVVIGPEPAVQELAVALYGDGDATAFFRLRQRFAGGAVATFSTGCHWVELDLGQAYLESFVTPPELSTQHRPVGRLLDAPAS